MIKFNVAIINCCTEIEGPFKRLTIWFQGCNLHCKGCCNKEMQEFKIRHLMSIEDLIDIIKDSKIKYEIEGVTYSGGEPTLQTNLPYLTKAIKDLGLGVISFTGHKYEEVKEILDGCDLVIDGSFEENNLDSNRKIVGSNNQRLIFLTDRYKEYNDWFYDSNYKIQEINLSDEAIINGDKI